MITSKTVGSLRFKVDPASKRLSDDEVSKLECFVNREWMKVIPESFEPKNWTMANLGIPSLVIRVDCSPALLKAIYEVDTNPFAIGVSTIMPGALLADRYVSCLYSLGIKEVAVKTYPSTEKFREDALLLEKHLIRSGIKVSANSQHLHLIASNEDFSIEGYDEDMARSLFYSDESKRNLVPAGLAEYLSIFDGKNRDEIIDDLKNNFPSGFVIKPAVGWGCGHGDSVGIKILATEQPFKKRSDTFKKCVDAIEHIVDAKLTCKYIVQPFYPPGIAKEGFEIYRLYLVYNPLNRKYEYAGGFTSIVPKSLRNHGTESTIMGWIN